MYDKYLHSWVAILTYTHIQEENNKTNASVYLMTAVQTNKQTKLQQKASGVFSYVDEIVNDLA